MGQIDQKALEEKISAGKELTKEEQTAILEDQGPVEGYEKAADMSPEDFDKEDETGKKLADEKAKELEKKEPEKPAAEAEDPFVKLEKELAKPEGQEDLKSFTDREKAYFHQMRRDRKSKQKTEAERDAALFREVKTKKELEDLKKPKVEEVDPIAELKKKDQTDYMTVADVLKIVESVKTKPAVKEEPAKEPTGPDPRTLRILKMEEQEARNAHPEDFEAVMELTEEIINTSQAHLIEVAKALHAGENPVLKAYDLIKADPEFAKLFPVAQTRVLARKTAKEPEKKKEPEKPIEKTAEEKAKEEKALAAQKALEENKGKKLTTGNIETSSSGADDDAGLAEYAKLSDVEFAKLPKATRNKVLRWMEGV